MICVIIKMVIIIFGLKNCKTIVISSAHRWRLQGSFLKAIDFYALFLIKEVLENIYGRMLSKT